MIIHGSKGSVLLSAVRKAAIHNCSVVMHVCSFSMCCLHALSTLLAPQLAANCSATHDGCNVWDGGRAVQVVVRQLAEVVVGCGVDGLHMAQQGRSECMTRQDGTCSGRLMVGGVTPAKQSHSPIYLIDDRPCLGMALVCLFSHRRKTVHVATCPQHHNMQFRRHIVTHGANEQTPHTREPCSRKAA